MKIKIFFLLVFSVLFVNSSVFAFDDVPDDYKYSEAINYLKDGYVVFGYNHKDFKPDELLNRAELLSIVLRARYRNADTFELEIPYKYNMQEYFNCFDDVKEEDWYTPLVCFSKKAKIISGYSDTVFNPSKKVNFVEALKITMKTYDISFDEKTDPWYKGVVDSASEKNLIPLDITSFSMKINRGQMADLITRVIKYKNNTLDFYLGNAVKIKQSFKNIEKGKNNINFFVNRHIKNKNYPLFCDFNLEQCIKLNLLDCNNVTFKDGSIKKDGDNCLLNFKKDNTSLSCVLPPDSLWEMNRFFKYGGGELYNIKKHCVGDYIYVLEKKYDNYISKETTAFAQDLRDFQTNLSEFYKEYGFFPDSGGVGVCTKDGAKNVGLISSEDLRSEFVENEKGVDYIKYNTKERMSSYFNDTEVFKWKDIISKNGAERINVDTLGCVNSFYYKSLSKNNIDNSAYVLIIDVENPFYANFELSNSGDFNFTDYEDVKKNIKKIKEIPSDDLSRFVYVVLSEE